MKRTVRRAVAAVVTTAAVLIGVVAPSAALALPDPPPGDLTAAATLTKVASVGEVAPGETFTYTLTIGCSSITDTGCRGAVLSDVVPAPFVVVGATVGAGANTASPPIIAGNAVTVNWITPLGDGTTGLLDATTGTVDITARLPVDASYDTNGIPVLNNAIIEGTNFPDATDQVPVTPIIPLDLATAPTKSISPASALAVEGTPVTAALGGANASNATVDSLVIQDPVDPAASPNPFEYAGFTGFGPVTPPAGATATAYQVYAAGAWVDAPGGALPAGVSAADVRGARIIFTGAIPAGATASLGLNLALTPLAEEQPDGTVVTNTVQSEVGLDGATATGEAGAGLTLRQNTVDVGASKSFAPGLVVAGESSTVTLGASNTSAIALEELRITEPSTGTFPDAYTFGGITGGISYPAGATTGTVIYTLADGTAQSVAFANGVTPAPPAGALADVLSFEVVFTGTILPGGETAVPFRVDTDPDLAGLPVAVPNEVGVLGSNAGATGSATATDDLYIYDEVVQPYVGKTIRPSQIVAAPGQTVTVSLTGGLTERPDPPTTTTGSTGNAEQVVIQDPLDPVEPNDWFNAFDITAVAQTPVPSDAALTIEYYDTTDDTWKVLTGPIAGPTIYSGPVPADVREVAGGIRFVYDYTDPDAAGFPPGTDFAPNFTSEVRAEGRYTPGPPFSSTIDTVIPDCAQSGATSGTPGVPPGAAAMDPAAGPGAPNACPEIVLTPIDPGTADLIEKAFGTSSSGGLKSVIARSGDTIPSTLSWSTGGFSGLERVELTDAADPAGTPLTSSVYNAFDLVRVEPITPATDPLIVYDQVTAVQLWNGAAWVDAANDPCPAACIGQFPGVTLNAGERGTTAGVRVIFAESPNRAAASAGNLDAPPVGSGVARSFANTRPLTLTWQVRDTRRFDGTPVLGDELYNLSDEGVVRNTANATGFPASGDPLSSDAQDDVVIVDVPITTSTDKNWAGGPLAVPPGDDLPLSSYPLSRVTVTTRNTTPARVDDLVIVDPAPGTVSDRRQGPFDGFLFFRFVSIDVPVGATATAVTLSCPGGSSQVYTREQALALTAATLPCDVTGLTVAFDGRIASNAAGAVVYDVRLRQYWRGTTERVSVADSPIFNTARGVVADVDAVGACPPPAGARYACDEATADIALEVPSFGVIPGKSISPAEQKENVFSPVTVTISGQPTGSTRPVTMVLEDADASFWNAVDFVDMAPGWTLPAPLGQVQACFLAGGTFTAATVDAGTVGGTWTCQPDATIGGPAAAAAFLQSAPATLHGVRFQVWQSNRLGWSNPSNPVVAIPFQVERRVDLRSGGAVPTTRADQVPAPGESAAGIFADTADIDATSVDIAPGNSLAASDSADAEYRNLHLEAAISVIKSPNGDVQPGVAIPFSLSFTNTGELGLIDPVFSDRLPTDPGGRQLIFDPDRDPSVPPWSFALTGSAPTPPDGTPLPTDPDLVTVTEAGDSLVFTMPAGSVLEPGQTYTITLQLVLRPGLTPNDSVQNFAAILVNVPLDACVPTYDADTGECIDDAVVRPLAVPALSTIKYVKADAPPGVPGIPDVFSVANGFECTGTANAAGFYRAPCVPVTLPGGTETWRFSVTNAGTLSLDRVVTIDNLPTPGDQGLIVTLPRGSDWQPTFVGGVQLVDAPAGAVLTTFYSTASVPCIADLNPLGVPCAVGAWAALDATTDPSIVRSLKFVVTFPDAARFQPGQTLNVQFQTRTTPTGPGAPGYPIAYDTVSTGGSAFAGLTRVRVPATEGRRVGVSYPTGPISLQKVVTGDGEAFAPDAFTVQPVCTLPSGETVVIPPVTLTPDAPPTVIEGLPWGATCTATETPQGQTEDTADDAVVGGSADIGLVTVTNVFDVAPLTIAKVVDSDATDASGDPIVYGPFTFDVSCTFLGEPVYATGYGPENPMTRLLSDGDEWVLAGLPSGAPPSTTTCTVTETDTDGAASVVMEIVEGDGPPRTVDGPSAEVTVAAGAGVTSTSTNFFGAGSLALAKVVEGPAGPDFGAGPFIMRVTCTLDGDTVWDGDVVLGGDEPLSTTIENIAAGATCAVVETDAAGATSTVIDPETVDIAADATVTVTATNTFDAGSITVVKSVDGDGADLWGAGPFEVTLECVRDGIPVAIPGGAARQLTSANGYTATYEPLLIGLQCAVTETDTGGATSTTVNDADGAPIGVVIVDGSETAVSLTNTFDIGSIVVTKTVSGADAAAHRSDVFAVTASCTWDGAAIDIPGGATRTLTAASAATYSELPVGAECAITESASGSADTVTLTPSDPADASRALVTVAAGAAASITVDNRFDPPLPATGGGWTTAASTLMIALALFGGGAVLVAVSRRSRRVGLN